MDRAILFRFHKNTEICESRIELLRELNPDVSIFGLGERIEGVERLKQAGMKNLYVIDDRDSEWKWKNGDLAIKEWYNEVGYKYPFDVLHVVEWDLLLTESLEDMYPKLDGGQLALTGLKPIKDAEEYGWPWVTGEQYSRKWEGLKQFVETQLGFSDSSYGCIFPGASFPREFLEDFSDLNIPELCNDEVRVPLIAEALGYELKDTGFFGEWGDKQVYESFNAKDQEIKPEKIREELNKEKGRRAFHPVRRKIEIKEMKEMKE